MGNAYKIITSFLLFILTCNTAFSQLNIDFPVERAIFQRNNNNSASISVFGTVGVECDKVEGRLIARESGQGADTDWVTIDSEIKGGSFNGKIGNTGGWYKLEVRAIKNDQTVVSSTVERVGIGEVFVIAGQSNAQGYGTAPNAKSANDDRVNSYAPNYFKAYWTDRYEGLPDYFNQYSFMKVEGNTGIGPGGYTAWCYGELGDMLTQRLNVPVLFFNAAYVGTSSTNWRLSAEGKPTKAQYIDNYFDLGYPYKALGVTIQSINTLLGFRSILWHQGEFDAEPKVSPTDYFNNVKYVIDKSREDIGASMPWMVARVSLYYGATNQEIINAQNSIIENVSSVWPGPYTDQIQPNRYDQGHFQNVPGSMGLTELANVWNEYLTSDFFSNSNPIIAKDVIEIDHYCHSDNNVKLTAFGNFNAYYWSNGGRQDNVDVSSGLHSFVGKDANGFRYSNTVRVSNVFPKVTPAVSAPDGLVGCEGKELLLNVPENKYKVYWNNGSEENTLRVTSPGTYFARFKSEQNCLSTPSNNNNVTFKAVPSKPVVTFIDSDGNECDGDQMVIAITNVQDAEPKWTNGATSKEITLTSEFNEPLQVTLYSLPTCPSEPSDIISYAFYERPATPQINYSGPFYLSAGEYDSATQFSWNFQNNEIENAFGNYLNYGQEGVYTVRASKDHLTNNGKDLVCYSLVSEPFQAGDNSGLSDFSVFPNPVSDGVIQVAADGEKDNVDVYVYDELGREVYHTLYDKLSYARVIDLTSKKLSGKYFVKLKDSTHSKVFSMFFVK